MAFSLVERRKKVQPLLVELSGANLRPMSGPLTLAFPIYDPTEVVPGYSPTPYRRKMLGSKPVAVEVVRRFGFSSNDPVRPGRELVLSDKELPRFLDRVKVAKL